MLEQILVVKKRELEEARRRVPLNTLKNMVSGETMPMLSNSLNKEGVHIIAEIKYRSPSRGDFPCRLAPGDLAGAYREGGASAISVLTDESFFGGSLDNLEEVRRVCPQLPLLRKDFILDRYQVVEARVRGASAYLLIVACLDRGRLGELVRFGPEIGLEPLVEVHDPYELERAVESGATILGVNNRSLKTFEVDLKTSFDLARRLEGEGRFLLVAESGISERSQILELQAAGFRGFLIGSSFMEALDPVAVLRALRGEA